MDTLSHMPCDSVVDMDLWQIMGRYLKGQAEALAAINSLVGLLPPESPRFTWTCSYTRATIVTPPLSPEKTFMNTPAFCPLPWAACSDLWCILQGRCLYLPAQYHPVWYG